MDSDSTPQEWQPEPVPTDMFALSGINVVGIGASAGGIRALRHFFANTPADSGMAFVVILHLPPNSESNLASVLQQVTNIPVTQVTEPMRVEPNHVYVIPPDRLLSMQDGTIQLQDRDGERVRRAPIDLFFRTLADTHGRNAAAVVLSGSGADGTVGAQRIKESGGAVLAQEPQEAEFNAMPRNVIATGLVDYVLPVAEIPAALREYWRMADAVQLPAEVVISDSDDVLREIFALLRTRTGHDFSQYKRPTLLRRIGRRMQVNNVTNLTAYLAVLRSRPEEVQALLRDLLISVTDFFRDEAWHSLAAIIPNLFANKDPSDQVRAWVAACATGEEAYTVAMLLYEHALTMDGAPSILVFATDIDEDAINTARQGLYPETIAADVSPERLQRFFTLEQGRYRIKKEIRDLVLFAPHNIVRDPPFSRLDLITCRNLLIYLNREVQEQVLHMFHFVLLPNGFLLLGASESIDSVSGMFTPIDKAHRLFQHRTVPFSTSVAMPSLPLSTPLRRVSAEQSTDRERHVESFAQLDLQVLARYGPPRVIVNQEYDIVHLAQGAGRFLTLADGEPSSNLIRLVHPDFRLELRTALFIAVQRGEDTETRWTCVDMDGSRRLVHALVQPIHEPAWASGYLLVLFNDMADANEVVPSMVADAEPLVQQLEEELARTKEQLSATVEQYETAVEEYKAANEELQAINEELRAATEELETSKEELQSVNEEIITVNHELKHNIDEVTQSNNDLLNLMASTEIGTIFVDRALRIRRYTPSAQMIFNMIPTDLNRPLAHITHTLDYAQIVADVEGVLKTVSRAEREVQSQDGRWYLARLLPYRTIENKIDGVIITFIDITERRQAEQELRESEEQFRALVQASAQTVWATDAAGLIVADSPSWRAFTGQTFDEWKGDDWLNAVHPDDRARAATAWQQVVQSGIVATNTFRLRHVSGEWRWTSVRAVPLRNQDGSIRGWVGMNIDVTEQKQAEEALRDSEARFRTLADTVPQIIWTNEANGEATYFNQRWFDFTGLSYEESVGPGWQAIVHPDDAPASAERWQRALAAGEVFDVEYRLRRADGAYRWQIGRNVPLRNGDGQIVGWFGSATDIEELKQAEAALRESEERFRLLVEGARDYAMFMLDQENRITFWSAGAEQVFGWSEAEVLDQSGGIIFTAEDRASGQPEQEVRTAVAEGSAVDRRWHVNKDGTRLFADGVLIRMDDEGGDLRGFVKVCRDATEQREAEEALHRTRDELENRVQERTAQLEQAKDRLQELVRSLITAQEDERRRIARELHDQLGQQLTALRLNLAALAGRSESVPHLNEQIERLQQIASALDNDVDRLAYDLRPSGLDDLGLHVVLQQHVDEWADRHGLPVELQIIDERHQTLSAEVETVVYRVVQEALTNVAKHARAEHVSVILEHRADQVRVIVEDDGQGFDVEAPQVGNGSHHLGLSGMRERVELVEGTITFESEPGSGTSVYIRIPLPSSD